MTSTPRPFSASEAKDLRRALAPQLLRRLLAERLGLRRISDLAGHPELRLGFGHEFLARRDGWPGLRARYGLGLARVEVMEHAVTYRAIASGQVDVMDVFSTDGQLERLRLRLLEDDRRFFPDYSAVLLARREMTERFPRTWARLREALEGRLDAARMARLNAMADLDGRSVPEVAAAFLAGATPAAGAAGRGRALLGELAELTGDHLLLVLISVGAAVVLGIPMGVVAARYRRAGQLGLSVIAMLQTVPALALLMFMIPLFGIGKGPALVALSLYALLPIARNTYAGMMAIEPTLLEIAWVLRLGRLRRLLRVELPLSAIAIMAGVKTAAVTTTIVAAIDVGFGNSLAIRGEGPGLSWEAGVPLECSADDRWTITLPETSHPIICKFLINDITWCAGEDYTVLPGSSVVLSPTF